MTAHDRPIPPLESLLQHRSWVEAVARRLLRDEAAAEDLAQEAWIRALRSPPDPARDPKPWLRRVLKNLASNTRRSAGRRARHEQVGGEHRARGREGTRSPEALVAEAEQHRRLVGRVLDLEEPFKTVLVLRFYEGLTPPEIAERMDTAVGTVHSRLSRAVERLKQRLDAEEGGDRKAWIAGLLPLAGARNVAPVATAGTAAATAGVLMTLTKSKFAWLTLLLVGCLVGGGFMLASITSGDDDVDTSADLRGVDEPDKGPSLETRGVLREAGDEALRPADAGAAPTLAGATPPAASGITWRGVVKDPEGNPLPGVDVLVMPGASAGLRGEMRDAARFGRTKTDRKGAFTLVQGAVESPRIVAWSRRRLPASKLLKGLDPANSITLVMPGPRIIRARVTREGHEGFLPLGVIFRTTEELFDYAHDPAKQPV